MRAIPLGRAGGPHRRGGGGIADVRTQVMSFGAGIVTTGTRDGARRTAGL